MKTKMFFVLSLLLAFTACDKDDLMLDDLVQQPQTVPLTRSSSSVPDPITQLDGIPVHIKSLGTGKYLSSESSGRNVVLYGRDDGSLRQRWNIVYGDMTMGSGMRISLIGGNSSFKNPLLVSGTLNGNFRPFLDGYAPATGIGMSTSENSLYYYINVREPNMPPIGFPTLLFVQPENASSNQIMLGDNLYKGDMTKWQIIPVDEFEIHDITYDLTTGDNLVVIPISVNTYTLSNGTDEPLTRTISIQETVSNESSFSNTEKLTVTIKNDASVKVGVGKFVEGSFSSGMTSAKEWSYTVGGREVKTKTITETVVQVVPARTVITARIFASQYNATLTYIAKLKGINTGKTIYLKGKWNGVVVQDSRIDLYYPSGELLRTIKSEPQ